MTADQGAPPKSGWAKLVPELLASDLAESLGFWRDLLGFAIAYQRPEEAFVYLERPEGAQIMLSQAAGNGRRHRSTGPSGAARCSRCTSLVLMRCSGRSKRRTGLFMPGPARSDARSAIEKRASAKSSCWTRTGI